MYLHYGLSNEFNGKFVNRVAEEMLPKEFYNTLFRSPPTPPPELPGHSSNTPGLSQRLYTKTLFQSNSCESVHAWLYYTLSYIL